MKIEAMLPDPWASWLGRRESVTERVTAAPAAALLATLDRDSGPVGDGELLAPLFHWLYFLPHSKISEVGADGHPKRGGLLPPIHLPRRMWAGGRLQFLESLRVGEQVTRESEITAILSKEGRTGRLVFVTVRHVCKRPSGGVAIVEEQDLVFRDVASAAMIGPPEMIATGEPPWLRELEVDPVLLFRYSALTFNGHRIHYDRDYATDVEGYPGLVVQAPLLATLLLDLVQREMPEARIVSFEFRAVQPLFDRARLRLCGEPSIDVRQVKLWAAAPGNSPCMSATALLA